MLNTAKELPSYQAIVSEFGLFGQVSAAECSVEVLAGGILSCSCWGCRRWRLFCEGRLLGYTPRPQYEVFTQEIVLALSQYIWAAAFKWQLSPIRVLEVGAGDGRLTWHLREALKPVAVGNLVVEFACVDDGRLDLHRHSPFGDIVEVQDAEAAVRERAPHLVLCSWMPLGVDWSAAFRAQSSVNEYLLIGEPDCGICGCLWRTWGIHRGVDDGMETLSAIQGEQDENDTNSSVNGGRFHASTHTDIDSGSQRVEHSNTGDLLEPMRTSDARVEPQYVMDNFERVDLSCGEKLQWPLQICRMDDRWSHAHRSRTVSFRREQ